MAGRASVWNDPKVRALTEAFVPATDECWRLQTSDDRQARFFRSTVDGDPAPVRGSRQGTYVFTPSGRLLARGNSTDPRAIERILVGGLAAWNALSPAEQTRPVPGDLFPEHRFEDRFPSDGLVLEAVIRDLPDEGGTGRWNLDHAWFSREEIATWVLAILPTAADATPVQVPAPAAILDRLVRYHLVDNARGQEAPFAPEEIEEARLTARVLPAESAGSAAGGSDSIVVALEGSTRAVTDGTWKLGDNLWAGFNRHRRPRGVETRLAGRATIDRATGRFTAFRLVATGETWGGSGLNGRPAAEHPRGNGAARAAVGWRFVEAGTQSAQRVPPAFIHLYGPPWVDPVEAETVGRRER